jgi:hypothetical protein
MNTWQPQLPQQSQPPPQPQSHVALGALIALAVVGAAIALLTALDRRDSGTQPGLAAAIGELHDARVELQASANELRSAAATLQEASRTFERRATTVNILDVMAPPPPPPAPPMPFPPMPDLLDVGALSFDGVTCSEPGRCTITRATIHAMMTDPGALARQARVMPSIKDGVTRGFKFYGIRPGSLPKAIGMRNGDLLTAINDLPLTSADGALEAVGRLRRVDELRLSIERKGEPVTVVVKID